MDYLYKHIYYLLGTLGTYHHVGMKNGRPIFRKRGKFGIPTMILSYVHNAWRVGFQGYWSKHPLLWRRSSAYCPNSNSGGSWWVNHNSWHMDRTLKVVCIDRGF